MTEKICQQTNFNKDMCSQKYANNNILLKRYVNKDKSIKICQKASEFDG